MLTMAFVMFSVVDALKHVMSPESSPTMSIQNIEKMTLQAKCGGALVVVVVLLLLLLLLVLVDEAGIGVIQVVI